MATISTTVSSISTTYERVERVPWYVWAAVFGVTSAMIGGQWDIYWHRSIGRDTFWTPAHMAIYLCALRNLLSAFLRSDTMAECKSNVHVRVAADRHNLERTTNRFCRWQRRES
jgi:hypothetical protein